MHDHGPWKVTGETCSFVDDHIRVVVHDVIQPDEKPGRYTVVEIRPGVTVLPLDGEGNVYLVRQFRFGLGCESLEAVAGGLDGGESALEAAQREAREELGILADQWDHLGKFEVDTSLVRSPGNLYLARGLRFTQTEREGTEEMHSVRMSFSEALQKAMTGEIIHAPSALLIFKAAQFLREAPQE